MKKIIAAGICALLIATACTENLNPDPELAGPLYGLKKGSPGSVDELVYKTWEEYGIYYLYDFPEYAFQRTNFSGWFSRWYTPVKKGNEEFVRTVIHKLHNNIFKGINPEKVKKLWYVRVFLCDSLSDSYKKDKPVKFYLENEDMLIIPNLGDKMRNYTDKEWNAWEGAFSELFIARLFLGVSEQPEAFYALRWKDEKGKEVKWCLANKWEIDPEGEYSPNVYTFRKNGYVRSKPTSFGTETVIIVDRKTDVGDYIKFLTKNKKADLEHTWKRFPRMLERALALIPYLEEKLNLDLVSIQNSNCPEDKVETDYFKNLKK